MITISNKKRAFIIGVLILSAYSMLTYSITKSILLSVITDIVSGLAVIWIPLLIYPVFNSKNNKLLTYAYVISRFIEGILMIIGGLFILNPVTEGYREIIYNDIHIYIFILGAILFYVLFYRTQVIPKFISIWGIIATLILLAITILRLFGLDLPIFQVLLLPIILNEILLAVWLMIKGFNIK